MCQIISHGSAFCRFSNWSWFLILQDPVMHQHGDSVHAAFLHVPQFHQVPQKLHRSSCTVPGRKGSTKKSRTPDTISSSIWERPTLDNISQLRWRNNHGSWNTWSRFVLQILFKYILPPSFPLLPIIIDQCVWWRNLWNQSVRFWCWLLQVSYICLHRDSPQLDSKSEQYLTEVTHLSNRSRNCSYQIDLT